MPSYDSFMCPNCENHFSRDLARASSDPPPSLQQGQNKVPRLSGRDRTLRFSYRPNYAAPSPQYSIR